MSDLAAALAALQADLPRIRRTATGQAGTRKYKYAAYDKILRDVRPIMAKHEFVWHTQPTLEPELDGDRFVLRYTLTHLPTGEAYSGWYPLAEGTAQLMGGQISYAKRYCLVAVLDLEVEGEDSDAMDVPQKSRSDLVRTRTTGPEHERLRQGLHEATPEQAPADRGPLPGEEDAWTGQPQGDVPPALAAVETQPGTINPGDRTRIMMLCGKMPREERLARVSALAGRQVASVNDLSHVEGQMVRKRLEGES